MTAALPMPDVAPDPLIDPADEARLEEEADRVFSPLQGKVPDDLMALLRDAFVIVAATDPNAIRARKRAREGGPVARSGVEAKAPEGSAAPVVKGKAR